MKKILYFLIVLSVGGVFAQNWQAIDNGLDGPVQCFLPDTVNDRLVLGGDFYHHNGVLQRSLACWNNTTIDSLGNFQCNPLFALGSWQGRAYATDCGTMLARSLTYHTNPWLPIDSSFSGTVLCYAAKDSNFYIGGAFNYINDNPGGCLGYWNSAAQRFVDIPLPYSYGTVSDIAFLRDTMYIVASFPDTSGISVTKVLRRTCNCRGWIDITPYLGNSPAWASSLEVYRDELYLAGNFSKAFGSIGNSIMRYDGAMWQDVADGVMHSGSYGQIFTLYASGDVLFIGGLFEFVGNVAAKNIAAWNGSSWCSVGHGEFNSSILAISVYGNELFVGGRFTAIDGVATKYIAKHTGNLSSLCHPIFTGSSEH